MAYIGQRGDGADRARAAAEIAFGLGLGGVYCFVIPCDRRIGFPGCACRWDTILTAVLIAVMLLTWTLML